MYRGTQARFAEVAISTGRVLLGVSLVALAGCGADVSENHGGASSTVTENAMLQAAFAVCVEQTRAELAADNPEIPAEVLEMLAVGARQSCESSVFRTCEQGLDSPACRVILDVYSR